MKVITKIKLFRWTLFVILVTPSILLTVDSWTNAYAAAAGIFVPVFLAFYLSKFLSVFYHNHLALTALTEFVAIAGLTDPVFQDMWELNVYRVTGEYVKRFKTDKVFANNELRKAQEALAPSLDQHVRGAQKNEVVQDV